MAWEQVFELVASGAARALWEWDAEDPVVVREGVVCTYPQRWFELAWRRYCAIWWRAEEATGVSKERLSADQDILFSEMLGVIGRSSYIERAGRAIK